MLDSLKALLSEVFSSVHHLYDASEDFEIISLCCLKRVLLEEWNDFGLQVCPRPDAVAIEVFLVIVVAVVAVEVAAVEIFPSCFKDWEAFLSVSG